MVATHERHSTTWVKKRRLLLVLMGCPSQGGALEKKSRATEHARPPAPSFLIANRQNKVKNESNPKEKTLRQCKSRHRSDAGRSYGGVA